MQQFMRCPRESLDPRPVPPRPHWSSQQYLMTSFNIAAQRIQISQNPLWFYVSHLFLERGQEVFICVRDAFILLGQIIQLLLLCGIANVCGQLCVNPEYPASWLVLVLCYCASPRIFPLFWSCWRESADPTSLLASLLLVYASRAAREKRETGGGRGASVPQVLFVCQFPPIMTLPFGSSSGFQQQLVLFPEVFLTVRPAISRSSETLAPAYRHLVLLRRLDPSSVSLHLRSWGFKSCLSISTIPQRSGSQMGTVFPELTKRQPQLDNLPAQMSGPSSQTSSTSASLPGVPGPDNADLFYFHHPLVECMSLWHLTCSFLSSSSPIPVQPISCVKLSLAKKKLGFCFPQSILPDTEVEPHNLKAYYLEQSLNINISQLY